MAEDNADYAKQQYWDERYTTEASYDWFSTVYKECVAAAFSSVEAVYAAQRHCRGEAAEPLKVLHLGIGNSSLCEDLHKAYVARYAAAGVPPPYRLVQVAVDYSPVVINMLRQRYEGDAALPDTHWVVADVRDLRGVRDAHGPCFDLVIDKATMDAFQAAKDDDVEENVAQMLQEMTWEIPYFRLHYTTKNDEHTYAWGTAAQYSFLGDSDLYYVFFYDIAPRVTPR